jgi:hypothetical protein
MAGWSLPDMRPWGGDALRIPPDSRRAWIQLAVWELWMGVLVCGMLGLGLILVVTAPRHVISVADLTGCYAPPPVALPCERLVYRGGALEAAFTGLVGVLLLGVAAWFLCELWFAAQPKPITDEFLRLLAASFGSNWRDPRTWPWRRVLWAFGFPLVGALLTASVATLAWTAVADSRPAKHPTVRVDTSESYTLAP